MDSRAKQRLTGAVILVALFVLLVPELLTGPRVTDATEGAPTDVLTEKNLTEAYGPMVIRCGEGTVLLDDTPHHHPN